MIIDVRRCAGVLLDLVIRYARDRIHVHGLLPSHQVHSNGDVRVHPPCPPSIHANKNESGNGRVSVVAHVMVRRVHGVDHDILPCWER
jgi:hypothetical protein